MKTIKESEITWITIDNNMRAGTVKGLIRVIENEGKRIYFNKRRAKKLKTFMLEVFRTEE